MLDATDLADMFNFFTGGGGCPGGIAAGNEGVAVSLIKIPESLRHAQASR